jgi:hypothetical protein
LKKAAKNELLDDIFDLFNEIDLLQNEENGVLSDDSIEF